MVAVWKRELQAYFFTPIGYVFMGVFLLVGGYYFTFGNVNSLSSDLGTLFGNLTSLFMLLVPILTMRVLSEERKNKTDQLLLTSPVSIGAMVVGKFLASCSVLLITLIPTLFYVIVIAVYGTPYWGEIFTNYLGFFLMGYLLGHYSPGRRMRAVIYCGGVIGYLWGVLGNLWTSSPKQVPLPFNGGYSLNHYLCAAALFLLCKTVCTHHERDLRPLEKMLASASNLVFGVYWIHVLILDSIADLLGGSVSVIQLLSLEISLTVVISFCAAMLIAKIPFLKKILI